MSFTTDQSRWRALTVRDPLADGQFVYTVKSTGIYCRPTCPARLARRANVGFFKTAAEAEAAGFRPCKRCKPDIETVDDPQARAVSKACALIDAAMKDDSRVSLKLQNLAKSVGLTPRYFHKIFKDKMGMTPKEYVMSKKCDLIKPSTVVVTNEGPVDMPFDFEGLDMLNPVDYNLDMSISPDGDWLQEKANDLTNILFEQEVAANLRIATWEGLNAPEPSFLLGCGVEGQQELDLAFDIRNSFSAPPSAPSIEMSSFMHLEVQSQAAIAAPISEMETYSAIQGQANMVDEGEWPAYSEDILKML